MSDFKKPKQNSKRTPNQRKRAEIRDAVRRSVAIEVIRVSGKAVNALIKWGSIFGIFYVIANAWIETAPALAGQQTTVDVGVNATLSAALEGLSEDWWHWVLLVAVTVLWLVDRTVQKNQIARISERSRSLQEAVDPHRSSSGMTKRGTEPED